MAAELPTNAEIADRFALLGDLLEIEGAVRHRVLAYRRAAARIRSTPVSVAEMAARGRATDLPDIGATLQAKIVELTETGAIAALEKIRERIPEGLAAIAGLEGIGPKRAVALWRDLGVSDLDALSAAVADGRLGDVAGFAGSPAALDALTRMKAHLTEHKVDNLGVGRAGPKLTFDPATERFTGARAAEANVMLFREYRRGFEVRESV